MTASAIAEALARRGLDETERGPKRDLFDTALQAFARITGRGPEHAWWVPGRLEVFGKHTDYGGGSSLVCAVPRGFALLAGGRSDGRIRAVDAYRGEEHVLDGAAAVPPSGTSGSGSGGWRNYLRVVAARLQSNFPGAPLGADLVFCSDLPSASGMSSSSALVTGAAAALAGVAGLRGRPEWSGSIASRADEAGYYACIENGMTFRALTGGAGVGTHGGSEDHVAIVCSSPGELTGWSFVPIERLDAAPLPARWVFVIAASGVAARKTGTAMQSYNRLSREASALLDLWNRHTTPATSLRDALATGRAAADHLVSLIQEDRGASGDPDRLTRRLRHFLREVPRTREAVEACRAGDRERLGALADASQADAEELLENQVPETVALARSARALGAFAASSFGAGFGGSVWALVERNDAAAFAERWIAHYGREFPARTAATVFTARPGVALCRVF